MILNIIWLSSEIQVWSVDYYDDLIKFWDVALLGFARRLLIPKHFTISIRCRGPQTSKPS